MFSFQLATPKAQADLAEAINPFLNAAPLVPPSTPQPVSGQQAAPLPSPEGAALLSQPRASMAQALLAQRPPQMPSVPGMAVGAASPAPQRFAVGGMATSLPDDPEDHSNAQDFVDTRNQQLLSLAKKPIMMARGGFAVFKD